MSQRINPIRGMKDFYGLDCSKYQYIVDTATQISARYGYQLIEIPIVENTEIFQRSLGDESDVVSKEMYSFIDKGGENITLRPEGTAGVMRAISSNGIFVNDNQPLKFMYYGPMFRYDRPQKGRYRQFHQIGFEHIGEKSPYTDVLSIALAVDILHEIGLADVCVHVNSLGGFDSRQLYTTELVKYFKKFENELSEDSKRRLLKNPLRILDSKDSRDCEINLNAPKIRNYLNEHDATYFQKVLDLLDLLDINYIVDQKLVRGLDYYTHTTFEFKTNSEQYSDALGGGGRYDGLLEMFGGSDVSGVGFALGVERLMMLIDYKPTVLLKVAIVAVSANEFDSAFMLNKELLDNSISCELITGGNNLKKRVELAVKRGCSLLLIIGNDELKDNSVTLTRVNDKDNRSVTIPRYSVVLRINELSQEFRHSH